MEPKIINGILIPANNSFEAINNFVHNMGRSPHYEELQWALLGAGAEMDKLRKALREIATYDEQSIWMDDRDDSANDMLDIARKALE